MSSGAASHGMMYSSAMSIYGTSRTTVPLTAVRHDLSMIVNRAAVWSEAGIAAGDQVGLTHLGLVW